MTAYSGTLSVRDSILLVATELRRGEYFAGLFILGCVSGLTLRIKQSVNSVGLLDSLLNTFSISLIVWVSIIAGVSLVLRDRTTGVRLFEIAFGAGFVFLAILPSGPLSWIAVGGLSLYLLASTNVATSRRGAYVLLATTVPMFWSRVLFKFFANLILAVDASLVGWLLGTRRTGNLVEFADGSGQLVIFQGCSSLANVSLAFLCWIAMSQLVCHRRSAKDVLWCLLACASVIAVNVTRITILGLSQWHFAAFHNPWGDAVTSVTIFGLTVGICALGLRRELFDRF
jgi:exosortase/archaeosortase family protein